MLRELKEAWEDIKRDWPIVLLALSMVAFAGWFWWMLS